MLLVCHFNLEKSIIKEYNQGGLKVSWAIGTNYVVYEPLLTQGRS